ncbi:TetR/AcrR family transcriptional regulator [Brevundimonas sp.]|uniref:TetR/AcrR family transcriptional regulator n=1 Tax=Brevundimonas sp. TaxID=1871086 RepID=UPI0028B197A9|nr:TetR/AcrR family transcriptional regulator [Brevundimonas sp.]
MNAPLVFTNAAVPLTEVDGTRRNKRQISKELTALRVIAAARFAFTNTGFFASTTRDIARRAGMSTGSVFATAPDKESLWVLAMGGPPPSLFLAEEVALIEAQRPDWVYIIRKAPRGVYLATLSPDNLNPLRDSGPVATGQGDSPAAALRAARLQADRKSPLQGTIQ